MINYFNNLLKTLQEIEQHLSVLASCVVKDYHYTRERNSILTKDWRDQNGK